MRRTMMRTALLALVVLGLAAPAQAAAPPPTVQAATVGKLGSVLVDARGRTLYRYTPDTENRSTCAGACATAWPPLRKGQTLTLGKGLKGRLGTIVRPDRSVQVTYNGIPLYLYVGDTKKGQATGQGAGRVWFVVKPGETIPKAATTTTTRPPTTTTSPPSAGGSGGGGVPDGYYY